MKQVNKTALVTGASTGIGRAIAIHLASEGAYVYLVARSKDKLEQTKEIIEKSGGKAKVILCDLSKVRNVNGLVYTVKHKTRQLDILVNVAGIWHGDRVVYAKTDYQDFSQQVILDTYHVGTIAPSLLIHGLLPIMPNDARIVNISGTFSKGKGWLPYYVSKRALEDLTVGLANELKDTNIKVNCISPSDTATEEYAKYFPQYIGEAIHPDKIAEYAVYLCSVDCQESGEVIVLKKGQVPAKGFHR